LKEQSQSYENNYCPNCGAHAAPLTIERGGLKFEIKYGPSYALLEAQLPENGHIIAEAGANPISTGLAVTCDLSAIGGSATQAFYDDGTKRASEADTEDGPSTMEDQ
jgi:hypothetical protein